MAAENQTGFDIDGDLYEVPTLDTFTMDEAQILYDYSGLGIEDFAQTDDDDEDGRQSKFRNPGLLRALMHISYQRKHPDLKPARVRELVGKANLVAAASALVEDVPEEDEDPLASTTEPAPSSERSSVGSSATSGIDSTNGSDPQDDQPEPTGTTRSDTSSPVSPLTRSAA